jgi:hypothetical protein
VRAFIDEETAALERGDLDAAVELKSVLVGRWPMPSP